MSTLHQSTDYEVKEAITHAEKRVFTLQWLAVVSDMVLGGGLLLIVAFQPNLQFGVAWLLRILSAGLLFLGSATIVETILRRQRFQHVANCLVHSPERILEARLEVITVLIFNLHKVHVSCADGEQASFLMGRTEAEALLKKLGENLTGIV